MADELKPCCIDEIMKLRLSLSFLIAAVKPAEVLLILLLPSLGMDETTELIKARKSAEAILEGLDAEVS